MQKIHNPFIGLYNCFGCSPDNPTGLRMEFFLHGDEIVSYWEPGENFAGYETVLHGGIQSTLIDEIASWAVFVLCETTGFTRSLHVDYAEPVHIDRGPLTLTAKLKAMRKNIAVIDVTLADHTGKIHTSGTAEYFTIPQKIAMKKMHYPGIQAFLTGDSADS